MALAAGIACWFLIPVREGWIACILGLCGLSMVACAGARSSRLARGVAIGAATMAFGVALVWWRASAAAHPVIERPTVARFTARVASVEDRPAMDTVRLVVEPQAGQGLPVRLRLNVDRAQFDPAITTGASVRFRARLVPPPGAAVPGAYDFARVVWFRGIGAAGRALDPPLLVAPPGQGSAARWIAELRRRLTAHVHDRLDGTAGGIAAALLTGDQGAIAPDDAEAMRTSGLAHLLSISGLHVAVVVGGVMLRALRLLALSRWMALHLPLPLIAAGLAALAGVAYTLLAGAEVPTVRSCIAALLVLVALALGREALTLRLVATGALLVLLLWPEALVGPSFQLSFAAVTTLVALHEMPLMRRLVERREEGMAARLGRAALETLLTGLAIEIALMPIAVYHFHKAGVYGAIANMIAIPLTTFVIIPLEALALALDLAGIGTPVWALAGIALDALVGLARWISSLPGALALLPAPPVGAFALMVLGALWLMLWRQGWRILGVAPLLAGLLLAIAAPRPDLFVTGDGRHVAIRHARGMILLRPRAGDYVRQMLGEMGGRTRDFAIDGAPGARCSADACLVVLPQGLRLLALRSRYHLDRNRLVELCGGADIVVSERVLPRGCRPSWLRADPLLLGRTGGLAIDLDRRLVITARAAVEDHPWY